MTDTDLLARADTFRHREPERQLIRDLAAALRARDTELATARTAAGKMLDWYGSGCPDLSDAERAWLASVSPPADGEER